MFILMSADVSKFPRDGANCQLLSDFMDHVMMGLARSVIGMLKNRSDAGGAVASKFDRSVGNLVVLDKCFNYDDDGKDPTDFSSIGILIFRMPWGDVGADDALVAVCPLLYGKPGSAKVFFIRTVTDRNCCSLNNSLGYCRSVTWTVKGSYCPLVVFGDSR